MGIAAIDNDYKIASLGGESRKFLLFQLGAQHFGINIGQVKDVIKGYAITPVLLASECVVGAINLRGKIVTAIDMKLLLKFLTQQQEKNYKKMYGIVVEQEGFLYSLLVDMVYNVIDIPAEMIEQTPSNICKEWREIAFGIYSDEHKNLTVMIDSEKLRLAR